jgi:hypothetical protein
VLIGAEKKLICRRRLVAVLRARAPMHLLFQARVIGLNELTRIRTAFGLLRF